MVQSITALPANTEIIIGRWRLLIKNHKVVSFYGMIYWFLEVTHAGDWDKAVLKLKENNISFHSVIETCATELEDDPEAFQHFIDYYYADTPYWDMACKFISTPAGADLTSYTIDKIRDCADWGELNYMMDWDAGFNKHLNDVIRKQVKQWYKI